MNNLRVQVKTSGRNLFPNRKYSRTVNGKALFQPYEEGDFDVLVGLCVSKENTSEIRWAYVIPMDALVEHKLIATDTQHGVQLFHLYPEADKSRARKRASLEQYKIDARNKDMLAERLTAVFSACAVKAL